MPEIAPFRGVVFDPNRVNCAHVWAPPYDVIDSEHRKQLADKDSHNCVRIVLPEGADDDKYVNAANTIESWLTEKILQRDSRPGIYRYHQTFTSAELDGRSVTRKGFVAAVRLHDFSDRVILPHERTLRGPKIDRLKLMKATKMHTSQIFAMYSDPSMQTDRLFRDVEAQPPHLEGTTDDGTTHTVWRLVDREPIGELMRLMAPLKLYIADGHHRYETMLAMRAHLTEQAGGTLPSKSSGNFGCMFLANMNDDGLIVLPTHRILHSVDDFDAQGFLDNASKYFELIPVAGACTNAAALRAAITRSASRGTSFAVVFPQQSAATLFRLRPTTDLGALGVQGSPAVTGLDVTVLHELVLERLLGITRAAQEAKTNLHYVKDTAQALSRIQSGEGQAGFIMDAPRVDQVRAVADANEIMPQKSTYFFPKIATGVVFNPIDSTEELT